jgi:large subunit ribosomal protein L23
MISIFDVIKAPLITEKGTMVSERAGQIVFEVDGRANKREIKAAVEQLFDVKVEAVRTANFLGKSRFRLGRRVGKRPNWKKAYITLADGQTIDLLEKV